MDGGSTDGSLEILRSYADRLTCYSAADEGAADAINKGFAKARGEILAWLGADDTYLPGAVGKAVAALTANPDGAAVTARDTGIGRAAIRSKLSATILQRAWKTVDSPGYLLGPFLSLVREMMFAVPILRPSSPSMRRQ
jgi:glycosyltransferase involved in cell wall biosynthesis